MKKTSTRDLSNVRKFFVILISTHVWKSNRNFFAKLSHEKLLCQSSSAKKKSLHVIRKKKSRTWRVLRGCGFPRKCFASGDSAVNKNSDVTVTTARFSACALSRAYRELAAVSLQTGRLLSLTRTLLLPVQGWHPVFRREGLSASNLPVLRDGAPFRTGSWSQRRTFGYRLLPLLVLLTFLALLIVRHRLRWWHWLVRPLFIYRETHAIVRNIFDTRNMFFIYCKSLLKIILFSLVVCLN